MCGLAQSSSSFANTPHWLKPVDAKGDKWSLKRNGLVISFKCASDEIVTSVFVMPRLHEVSNFLVRSALKNDQQPNTFQCARARCKTCPFILNTDRISGPKGPVIIYVEGGGRKMGGARLL